MSARTFERLTLADFRARVGLFHWTRAIDVVHVHGTWKPTHADWKGEPSMRAMWRFHTMTNKWRDIAQHVTIAPTGELWTGRDWNWAPASDQGDNGSSVRGPFMLEIVGNFDYDGPDKLQGGQLYETLGVIDAVQRRFALPPSAMRFHRQLPGARKTCPGSAVDFGRFLEQLAAYRAGYASATSST